ncbi:MAG: AAA family ATPase [Dehalococcoidia bacterium]|nr:AAA family ATPase [Dehalococcoidia bacterium]
MAEAIRVLIVDEDPDSRVAARKSLQRAQLAIAGETGFGTAAVSLAAETRPDAILIAVEDPVARPLETAEAIANLLPATPIIIYSSLADAESVRRAMVFGARDYILRPLQADNVRAAVFRALEQEERRQMRRAGQLADLEARGSVITIAGAKGGIGKTFVTVNLALGLARETGKSVAIVDADTQFGDVATMFDIEPAVTNAELVRDLAKLDRNTIRDYMTAAPGGVSLLAASEDDIWFSLPEGGWAKLIDLLAQVYEFVLVDTSGSFDPFTRQCIEASTLTLLVTSGEVSSIRDTAAAVRRLDRWGIGRDDVRLVLNRTGSTAGLTVPDLEAAVARPLFWEVPNDRSAPASVQSGRPLVTHEPNARAANSMISLARLIAGTRTSLVERPEDRPGLFKRLLTSRGRRYDPAVAPIKELPEQQ